MKMACSIPQLLCLVLTIAAATTSVYAFQPPNGFGTGGDVPISAGGIFPGLAATADSGPKRSECGIGALMPWADRLYMVSYLSVPNAGGGTGLYEIYPNMTMSLLRPHNSTYANRIVHAQTDQIIIGAWAIDVHGNVKTFEQLLQVRIGGVAMHLNHPETMVYMLSMDGPLYECDVIAMNCTLIFDLVKELNIPADAGEQPHFKAAHSMGGRLIVASNTFEQADDLRQQHGGRLAEWKGPGTPWEIIETTAFVEVAGRSNFGKVVYATGWDFRSVILKVLVLGDGAEKSNVTTWQTFRLPKASHAFDHLWQTEWPRIREVATERYLLDMHAMFYELSPLGWGGATWGIRPIAQHLRVVPDFTSFRGFFVMGGNQVSSIFDNNLVTGQAQSGLWFGKVDDLWSFGKPQGWGSVWEEDAVSAGPSDPFLMTGFDKKTLHIIMHSGTANVAIQVDFNGRASPQNPQYWVTYDTFAVGPGAYKNIVFPSGFSAHWVRVTVDAACTITATFHYT